MTKMDVIAILKSSEIFAALSTADLTRLSKKITTIELKKNGVLFHQGDVCDCLYIVSSGKLIILLKAKGHPERALGDVHVGETIGEASALSHEPRAATVKAIEASTVLKLERADFVALCDKFPEVLYATMNMMLKRSRDLANLFTTHAQPKRHIVLTAAHKDETLQSFFTEIKNYLHDDVLVLDDTDANLQKKFKKLDELKKYLDNLDPKYKKIIYMLSRHDSIFTEYCNDNMDMLYVLADCHEKPHIRTQTHKLINSKELLYKSKPELIILHPEKTKLPKQSRRWLRLAKFGIVHHLRMGKESDWQRIMRFIRSEAIGLVLGGGGVRGWSHIGALKALTEAGIPIDAIGGSSGGAIVAGYYALHETYENSYTQLTQLSQITRQTMYLRGLTWPAVSFFSSANYTRKLKQIFRGSRLEDLWRPLFCVTCNLSESNAVMHRRGFMWRKIRGSTAVPGVYPPLVIKGELHLDGGIVDNLPVGVMHNFSSNIGTVIAVELIHNITDEKNYKFPPVLPFWQTLLTKLRLIHRDYHFPPMVDTFLRSLLVGSAVKQNESAEMADILISPDLSGFNLLSVTPKQEEQLIELGYKATVKALKNWQDTKRRPKDKNIYKAEKPNQE